MNGFIFILYMIICLQTDDSDSTFCQWGYEYTLNLRREHINHYQLNACTPQTQIQMSQTQNSFSPNPGLCFLHSNQTKS